MERNINSVWTSGVPASERERISSMVKGSPQILNRLLEIIKTKMTALETVNETDYSCPSWSHKQAHLNGKKEALRDMMTLFSHLENKGK